jgi:hypothetical protein
LGLWNETQPTANPNNTRYITPLLFDIWQELSIFCMVKLAITFNKKSAFIYSQKFSIMSIFSNYFYHRENIIEPD